jgi:hypothetical protein
VSRYGGEGDRSDRSDRSERRERQDRAERSDRRSERGPQPRKEKIDPWFLKPYEPSQPAEPRSESVLSKSGKNAQPPKRAALLGGFRKI